MRQMLAGRIERTAYVVLLRNLFPIYQALEASLTDRGRDSRLATLRIATIARGPALAADLAYLHGPDWERGTPELPAARRYADRILAARASAELFAAHAYVRYLGDMSGGQALGRVVGRGLGLKTGDGLSFYRFPAVPDLAEFKVGFRHALEAIPSDRAAADRMVREAKDAFEFNVRLLDAVATQTSASAG